MLIFYEFVTFSVDILSELSKRANAPCNTAPLTCVTSTTEHSRAEGGGSHRRTAGARRGHLNSGGRRTAAAACIIQSVDSVSTK